jgi:arsenate reductase
MPDKRKVLFLCTGNSCRSQMAEAILRHSARDQFEALSAGSHPAGFVHPLAVEAMRLLGVPMESAVSKSWDEFADAWLDVVITLCDVAAVETCPAWPGAPITAHWSLPDPAGYLGTNEERIELALRVAQRLQTKIQGLIDLDWSVSSDDIAARLEFLGEI